MGSTFVDITTNADEVERKLAEITDKSKLVMMRAMNRTASVVNTSVKKKCQQDILFLRKKYQKHCILKMQVQVILQHWLLVRGQNLGWRNLKSVRFVL